MPACHTCQHPDRERIEFDLACARNTTELGPKWGVNPRSLRRHRSNCMTQEQVARLRGLVPAQVEVNIAELTRRGGEDAMLTLKLLRPKLSAIAEKAESLASFEVAVKYRKLEVDCCREQLKIAALYPGKKSVTNNNLVVADGAALFELVDRVLATAGDVSIARKLLAAEFRGLALEHQQ